MKKMLTIGLSMALLLGAAPIFAAEFGNPCVRPVNNTGDPNAVRNYESCMAEYNKSLTLTGQEREDALERAREAMRDHEDLQR